MKVEWRSTDMEVWDQAHAAAAGPLQQDWAYGSTMVSLGARVLRARVEADGVTVAQAQCIVRQYSPWLSFALCTRGPLWLQPLPAKDGAEKSELNVQRMGTNPGQYRWLLDAEMQQRAERHLDGMPLVWFERYAESRKQPARNLLSLRADIGRERLAGMMFLIHGQAATYQVGWTSDQGRDLHAHNLMLWRGIEALQERGVRLLDLGGVNTQRSAGVARFKMATGGTVKQLAGSYLL
ncbi:MAG: GNAT family N-acetyltransferase [Betaproteobacteria bacterium]|nr:GNAT family N-acetyltransferase [Betaproteobacteria bacterium]